jgi:hypothetical protein
LSVKKTPHVNNQIIEAILNTEVFLFILFMPNRVYTDPYKTPSPQGGPFGWLCNNFICRHVFSLLADLGIFLSHPKNRFKYQLDHSLKIWPERLPFY